MENRLIKVGITHGDINGVGYEIILKTFADERVAELCIPIIYGSQKIACYHQKILEFSNLSFKMIKTPEEAVPGKLNLINCIPDEVRINIGKPTPEAGLAAFRSLEAVVADAKRGAIDTILTAPVNKYTIQNKSFHFAGHTEYLEAYFGEKGTYKSLMILMRGRLRVALATGHIPLGEVKSRLTRDAITEKLVVFNTSLKQDFNILKPRIAVLALNPHAGDNGLLGDEEQKIIKPAMIEAEKNGVMTFGPYPADGFFGSDLCFRFDGILAMYHDQGLAPFKALAMEDGVNYTAGLPVVRTSPAHGTAYDIAGQNKASEESFRQALYASLDICRNRDIYREITSSPLKKQYVDKSGDNVKLDLTKEEPDE
ncbi:MAG: 4-hydroxythreonine-4-phosphate dehydrogenase PdxA [Tannerella sp.]|jgi:4-hydroxythreonine-4-phosphate dehydrogenase|nr:4-hydroxythreonine-4-phosphate dehydrogenase PdxA [Tannerella sp.]